MVTIRRGYVNSSVGQIHYRFAREGGVLLLPHQSATSSVAYEPIMQYLAANYSTIAMDTPGFGMSDYPKEKFTVTQYANIVLEFMDTMSTYFCKCLWPSYRSVNSLRDGCDVTSQGEQADSKWPPLCHPPGRTTETE